MNIFGLFLYTNIDPCHKTPKVKELNILHNTVKQLVMLQQSTVPTVYLIYHTLHIKYH